MSFLLVRAPSRARGGLVFHLRSLTTDPGSIGGGIRAVQPGDSARAVPGSRILTPV